MPDQFVVRPKDEDEQLQKRVKELEDREAARRTWRYVRWGLFIASVMTTGIPILLPGDGDAGS